MLIPLRSRHMVHFLCCVLVFMGLQACAGYQKMPLDSSTVAQSLQPPGMEAIRAEAKEIKHPILKPVDIDDRNGLSPDEAAIIAVLANPTLRAARDRRGLARAQLLQAGILPNPQFSYSLDIPTGGDTQGTVNAFGLALSWDTLSLITRGDLVNAARAYAVSVDLDVAWQEWQVAEAAKQHVYHLLLLEKELAIAKEGEEGLQKNRDAVKQSVALGDMTAIDLSAAEVALQTVHLSVLSIEQQLEQERLALNQSIGFPPERSVLLQRGEEPPSLGSIPNLSGIMDGIEERRLDLLALKKGYLSQESRLRAAILAQFPRISIGFSQARDNTNVVSTGFSITVDLPFFDRNQGNIAIEKATRKKLFDEYTDRLFQARSHVATILADMVSLKGQIDATERSILTQENLVQIYYKAFLEGNADVLSYYNARNSLISKQIEVLRLKQTLADQNIALEIAAGEYLGQTQDRESSR